MAPPGFDDVSFFEKTQISSNISAEDAPSFFQKYGVFYQANEEIGALAISLARKALSPDDINHLKPILEKDPRLCSVLSPFIKRSPAFYFTLGSDPGNFYALTTNEDPQPRALIYIWQPRSQLEFSHGSHIDRVRGVASSNGLTHIPYSNLSNTRNLKDISISLEEGGILIVHTRLAVSVKEGFAIAFGCQSSAT